MNPSPSDNTPETVQTVQPGDVSEAAEQAQGRAYIEVAQDDKGEWHWCLWSPNGRAMATNAITYKHRSDCTKAVKILQDTLAKRVNVVIRHS